MADAPSSNGKRADSDSVNQGSNPCGASSHSVFGSKRTKMRRRREQTTSLPLRTENPTCSPQVGWRLCETDRLKRKRFPPGCLVLHQRVAVVSPFHPIPSQQLGSSCCGSCPKCLSWRSRSSRRRDHNLRWEWVQPPRPLLPDSKTGAKMIWLGSQALEFTPSNQVRPEFTR